MKFCIVSRVFDKKLVYRENIIYEAIVKSGNSVDVYYVDYLTDEIYEKSYNLIRCKKLIWYKDASLSFSSKLLRKKYDIAIISDIRQFFPLIFAIILKIKGTKIIYEHEQRSYGNKLVGIIYSFLIVIPFLFIMVRISDIVRVPNLLCYRIIKNVRCKTSKLLFIPLAIRENKIINKNDKDTDKDILKIIWTGKEPNKKNIALVIEAFLRADIKLSTLTIVTNEIINYPITSKKIKIINELLSYDNLIKFYMNSDIAIWTSPTQSFFDAAAVGCHVVCPENNILENINEYTNLINRAKVKTDINGLCLFNEKNILIYKDSILEIKNRKNFIKKKYDFTGSKYLEKLLTKFYE